MDDVTLADALRLAVSILRDVALSRTTPAGVELDEATAVRYFAAADRLADSLVDEQEPGSQMSNGPIPTIESLTAAARAGVTVIQPGGQTTRIHGASAAVGNSVIDVLYDAEKGTFSWVVDGFSRTVDWVRRFLDNRRR